MSYFSLNTSFLRESNLSPFLLYTDLVTLLIPILTFL